MLKKISLITAVALLAVIMSCGGKNDDPGPTLQEQVIKAIDGKTATLDVSNAANSFGDGPVTAGTVSLTASDAGVGSFTITGGDLGDFVDGGSFTVSDGTSITSIITNVTVNADAQSNLAFTGATASINSEQDELTISFTSNEASAARSNGIGTWKMILPL